jgi:hypothetical protein
MADMLNGAVERSKIQRGQRSKRKRKGINRYTGKTAAFRKQSELISEPFAGSGVTLPSKVDIMPLIKFAAELSDSPLKTVLLSEEPTLDVSIFLARYPVWISLARIRK